MLRKLTITLVVLGLAALVNPASTFATKGETQTCTQVTQYGGTVSYVCGVHTPIETGIADNLPLVGSSFVGASAVLAYFGRKIKRLA